MRRPTRGPSTPCKRMQSQLEHHHPGSSPLNTLHQCKGFSQLLCTNRHQFMNITLTSAERTNPSCAKLVRSVSLAASNACCTKRHPLERWDKSQTHPAMFWISGTDTLEMLEMLTWETMESSDESAVLWRERPPRHANGFSSVEGEEDGRY